MLINLIGQFFFVHIMYFIVYTIEKDCLMINNTFLEAKTLYDQYSIFDNHEDLADKLFRVLEPSTLSSFGQLPPREIINTLVMQHYPNEATIKAAFIDNILKNQTNQIVIFEFNVKNSRADLCKINGNSTVFEIKTDLDNEVRLEKQLQDYSSVFEQIFIICSEARYQNLKDTLHESVGAYTYSRNQNGRIQFTLTKKAQKNQAIDSQVQLEALTKKELTHFYPIYKTLEKKEMIYNIARKYAKTTINKTFKEALKMRYKKRWEFLLFYKESIYEIDYQWFYNNPISPELVYNQ